MDGTAVVTSRVDDTPRDPIFIPAKEAARLLSLSVREIYRMLDDGRLLGGYHGAKRVAQFASVRKYADLMASGAVRRPRRRTPAT